MSDYIEFLNWPEKRWGDKEHPFDRMTMKERFEEYIKLKIDHPVLSDENLSKRIGKGVHYFTYLKKKIRSEKR